MGKFASNEVLDGSLQVVAGATRMVAVAGQPASFADATAGRLVEAALAPGDFAVAAGDFSGRKVDIAGKTGLAVIADGVADHVALLDASRLLYVTTCPAQGLVAGGLVSIAGWSVEIGAPV